MIVLLAGAAFIHAKESPEIVLGRYNFALGSKRVKVERGLRDHIPYFRISCLQGDSRIPSHVFQLSANDMSGWVDLMHGEGQYDVIMAVQPMLDMFIRENRRALKKALQKPFCHAQNCSGLEKIINSGVSKMFASTANMLIVKKEMQQRLAAGASFPAPIEKRERLDQGLQGHPLIVTHATMVYDGSCASRQGIDELISAFKELSLPVIYLMSDEGMQDLDWFTKDRDPSSAISSKKGEHSLPIQSAEVTLAGGYADLCLKQTALDAASRHFEGSPDPFTINMPMGAIYSAVEQPAQIDEYGGPTYRYRTLLNAYREDGKGAFLDFIRGSYGPDFQKRYAIEVWIDGVKEQSFGSGDKTVRLRFWAEPTPRWIK